MTDTFTKTMRSDQLAEQFQAVHDDVIRSVSACTGEQWRQPCASEGWSVGVVAHHIAVVQRDFSRIIEALVAGETYSPRSSMEEVDQGNARHARDYAAVGKEETLDTLRRTGAIIPQLLRDLDDDQLDRTAGVFGGNELSVARMVEWIVIGHAGEHLASIRATLAE